MRKETGDRVVAGAGRRADQETDRPDRVRVRNRFAGGEGGQGCEHCRGKFDVHFASFERSGMANGCATSKARAARSTPASAYLGPMMCKPTGNPAPVSPQGIEAAGCWVRLKGKVNGVQLTQLFAFFGVSLPTSNAATES